MKVNDPNLSSLGNALNTAGTTGTQQAGQTGRSTNVSTGPASNTSASNTSASSDDVHLSELVRSLRSLAADSPERQARLEQLARSYASGTYQVDSHSTASKIVDDAIES